MQEKKPRESFFTRFLLHLFVFIVFACITGCVVRCVVVTIFCKFGPVGVLACGIRCIVLFIAVHTVLPPFVPPSFDGDGKYQLFTITV